jgi:hypothetical protein
MLCYCIAIALQQHSITFCAFVFDLDRYAGQANQQIISAADAPINWDAPRQTHLSRAPDSGREKQVHATPSVAPAPKETSHPNNAVDAVVALPGLSYFAKIPAQILRPCHDPCRLFVPQPRTARMIPPSLSPVSG